uniref:Uncharacterized protein n=1 Tax=Anguilla anguilla TaxID=7936 RepID=A0A0E9SPF1_ANGAN
MAVYSSMQFLKMPLNIFFLFCKHNKHNYNCHRSSDCVYKNQEKKQYCSSVFD